MTTAQNISEGRLAQRISGSRNPRRLNLVPATGLNRRNLRGFLDDFDETVALKGKRLVSL
jgi:hypothetical protein